MKFTLKLASRVRDELFDDYEKIMLSTVVGSRYIDIASKLFTIYGRYQTLASDEEEFLDNFAFRKSDATATTILAQLKTYREELDKLTNPENFYKQGSVKGESDTTLVNNFESTTDNKDASGSYNYNTSDNLLTNKSGTLVRGATTQTSQKNKGIENKWRKDLLLDVSNPSIHRKEIDKDKLLGDDFKLSVQEAHYEVVPEEQSPPEDVGGELYSNINVGLTGAVGSTLSNSVNEAVSLSKSKGNMKSESETYSSTNFEHTKKYSSYIHNEATLRVLRLNIPKLQSRFFNLFADLFIL